MCATMFALESELPRPNTAPSRSLGSNGGDDQSDSSPAGHDVVVAVEEHGRSARGRRNPARYHRGGIGQRERVELVHAGLLEQLDDEIVGRDQRLARKVGKCDRRNAYESAEIGRQLGHE